MAGKKKEPPKPLYPLHHEHADSLQNVLNEATMLLNTIDVIKDSKVIDMPEPIRDRLVERCRALRAALYGAE